MNSIREAAEKYSSVYVFSFENMRNQKFKEFREQLKSSSRFFLGSNKVMQVALGRSASDEIQPGLYKVSKVVFSSHPFSNNNFLISFHSVFFSYKIVLVLFHSFGYFSYSYCVEMLGWFLPICLKKKLKGN